MDQKTVCSIILTKENVFLNFFCKTLSATLSVTGKQMNAKFFKMRIFILFLRKYNHTVTGYTLFLEPTHNIKHVSSTSLFAIVSNKTENKTDA